MTTRQIDNCWLRVTGYIVKRQVGEVCPLPCVWIKGHLSRSRRNGDGQVIEADENVRVYQNLNTLIGELALAKSGQLSPGIPCL
jgi:hypothetical protein